MRTWKNLGSPTSIRATIKYAIIVNESGFSAHIVGSMRSENNKLQISLIQTTELRAKIAFSNITIYLDPLGNLYLLNCNNACRFVYSRLTSAISGH